jgi:hypothetical protein
MKFIKQSSIDNLLTKHIDVVIGATEELKRKVFTISAFSFYGRKGTLYVCML